MEQTLKDVCFSINSLSTDFSVLGRNKKLSQSLRDAFTRVGIELFDLDRQLYLASFIKNDTKIASLAGLIKKVGKEADQVNKELKEATQAVKRAREIVQQATEIVERATEGAKEIKEKYEKAMDEVDRILKIFGIDID